MSSAETVRLVAPAKLTLSLRVVGLRDDGLHLIEAEMVTLDLYDEIRVDPGDGCVVDGPAAAGLDLGEDNLASRAMALAGRTGRLCIHKRIPAGAGLGGGSADAAAVLRWAGIDDLDVAAGLGADVPFCVIGGRARVRGIGEVVEPLPHLPRQFTLLTPAIHSPTPEVYRMWDELGGPGHGSGNDLTDAALEVTPALAEARDRLADATGKPPRLAGSGSTWFVEGAFPGPGLVVAASVPPGWVPPGWVPPER